MKRDRIVRAGLYESLEQFAARIGSTPDKCRISWRLQGLRRLFPNAPASKVPWEDLVRFVDHPGCRIAPGISVPTNHPELESFLST